MDSTKPHYIFETLFELLLAICAELFGEFLLELAAAALSDLVLRALPLPRLPPEWLSVICSIDSREMKVAPLGG
jgi:hypothetical protein